MAGAAPLVCLASMSPRRAELLIQIGVPHLVCDAGIDEAVLAGERPADYVVRLACEKARTVRSRGSPLPVLAADTTVVIGGLICAKPRDRDDAIAMLGRLSGRTHQVLTAVALASRAGIDFRLSASDVRLRPVSPQECAVYWETGEPHDKAGGYAIQGRAEIFVKEINGSYSNVVGLPLSLTVGLLKGAGFPC